MTLIERRWPSICTLPMETDSAVHFLRTLTTERAGFRVDLAEPLAILSTARLGRSFECPCTHSSSTLRPAFLIALTSRFHRSALSTGVPARVAHRCFGHVKIACFTFSATY